MTKGWRVQLDTLVVLLAQIACLIVALPIPSLYHLAERCWGACGAVEAQCNEANFLGLEKHCH